MAENLDFDPPEATAPASIGTRLRTARKARGVSLDEIAAQTRIPVRHLEHIENDGWDSLPSITYSVGFTRAFANAVGLDGAAIGAELRETLGGRSSIETHASHYQPADPARVPPRSLALIAALIAIVLVGGYLIWRNSAVGNNSVEEVLAEGQQAAPPPATAPPLQQPAQQPLAAPATGPVVLTATDAVWLRVSDGGRTLYQGEMKAGDRYEVPTTAARPQIRTGRPNALRVTVGQTVIPPLGAAEQTIDNVSLLAADLAARAAPGAATNAQPGFSPAPATPPAQ